MWKPHPGPQTEFLERPEFEVLFGGAAGPGKTDCLIAEATRYVQYPDYKGIIFRRTFPQLGEIIDRCFQHYPSLGGTYRSTEHRWYFPGGASILLGHMQHENDKYQYQGKEFQFIGFDELTQFSETQYTYLHSRARSTNPNMKSYVRATTNPGGLGHRWVKDRFVTITEPKRTYRDPKTGLTRCFIPATISDNPTLFENDPDYVQKLENLPEIEKLRLKYGIWDAFEGQVFTELSQRVHGIEPFDIPPEWDRICVLDWGFAKPFSVGWYAIDYDGILYRYREWYGCKEGEEDTGLRMPAYDVARGILERETERVRMRIADPSIWHPRPDSRKMESKGATIQEDMANEGVFFLKADNDRIQGKMQVHKRLRIETETNEETGEILSEHPMFRCFNDHHHFWRTMESLQENQRNPEDVDTKQEDHIYDEFRYVCMNRPIIPKRHESAPVGSFQYERSKLIRAKQYARRTGCTITQAYSKVR